MDDQYGPWLVVGGYVVALGLLWLGGRWDGRRPAGAAVTYGLAGVAFVETTLFWLSAGTNSAVPTLLWFALPVLIAVLVAWHGYRQRTWVRRIGGTTTPTFGVFPADRLGVPYEAADHTAIAATVQVNDLLGVEYTTGGQPAANLATMIDGTYTMVQLRTPVVPSMVISPVTAAFEPERFTPLEDARITRNSFAALRPDAFLRAVDQIDRAFAVTAADPSLAGTLLTEEVVTLLTTDPWFRVRQIACHDGALYSTESGPLTEERLYGGGQKLTKLATLIPWPDEPFHPRPTITRNRDTLRGRVNRRREKADRQPVSAMSFFVRTTMSLIFLLAGVSLAVNSVAALTGLAKEVSVKVTQSYDGGTPCRRCHNEDAIDGTYQQDGQTHEIEGMWWMSFSRLPDTGETVTVAIGPLWWHPYIEHKDAAVFMLLIGLIPLLAGTALTQATFWPRSRNLQRTPTTP